MGKIPQEYIGNPRISVHPHVRGEDVRPNLYMNGKDGSPPRAWGRFSLRIVRGVISRFTPTCVGKMFIAAQKGAVTAVHPHVRGEDGGCVYNYQDAGGSPPRAWGRSAWDGPVRMFTRFTPTCVGKIPACCLSGRTRTVHPHVRGEDCIGSRWLGFLPGSPPRAWGRCLLPIHEPGGCRFTPTCVGKMPAINAASASMRGSPPRAWGR